MLKNSILTLCAHVYQEKLVIWIIFSIWSLIIPFSCSLYYFVFFQKLLRRTTALVNWADQHEKGRAVEALVMKAMSSEESCYEDNGGNTSKVTKYSVHRLQWASRGIKKIKKKNLTRLIRKSSPEELKRESYPGLLGNLLLDAHLLKFPEWAITQKKNCFSN